MTYTRDEVLTKARALLLGQEQPDEVAAWAAGLFHPGMEPVSDQIELNEPALHELISNLSLAAAFDSSGNFIYTNQDYRSWIDEYLQH